MKLLTTPLLLAALVFSSCAEEDNYESIFDGETLSGWTIMEKPENNAYHATEKNYLVKDGAIHCLQLPNLKGGLLLSDKEYSNFELELEINSDFGCDSGIFIRCQKRGVGIQILNDFLRNGVIGFPFGQGTGRYISMPLKLNKDSTQKKENAILADDRYDGEEVDGLNYSITAEKWNKTWKQDSWNTLKIRCTGSEPLITTWLNGEKIMEMDGRSYKARGLGDVMKNSFSGESAWDSKKVQKITENKGHIGFQIHPGKRWKVGGAAKYKNIKIKELP